MRETFLPQSTQANQISSLLDEWVGNSVRISIGGRASHVPSSLATPLRSREKVLRAVLCSPYLMRKCLKMLSSVH